MTRIYASLTAIVLSMSTIHLTGQLIVTNTMTATQYIQNVLLGSNVSASNITINGQPGNNTNVQIGEFNVGALGCNMPIQSGLIMASGGITGAVGPNNSSGQTVGGNGLSNGTDPDLLQLCFAGGGSSIHEWIIVEFDFVPLGDTLRFNYVFASEEYPEWVSSNGQSSFNDFFGFFLSGPGINGTFSNNAVNLAQIPGTNIPVGIGTLNNGSANAGPCNYCEYYNQDGNGFEEPSMSDPYYMQYDGYTDILTAQAVVQCGQTYHIKLAISDSGDQILDSAVFLERESFSSNLVVQVAIQFEVGGPNGNTLFEDCGDAFITFSRPQSGNVNTELEAYITYGGQAVMGVDYTELPDTIYFAPGVMSVSFPVDAFQDGIPEGVENVFLTIMNFAQCAEIPLESFFEFYIQDTADPLNIPTQNYNICQGASLTIDPVIQGGYGAYHYLWSTGEITETITVSPPSSTSYLLTVSDTCGLPSANGNFNVNVAVWPPLGITINSGDLLLECGESVNLTSTATGGDGNYEYSWYNQNGTNLWGWDNNLWYSSWNGEGLIIAEVEDGCGFIATDTISVNLNVPDIIVDAPSSLEVNCNQNFNVNISVSGGLPPYWFSWYANGNWINWLEDITYSTSAPVTLEVWVSDNCGQTEIVQIPVTVLSPPIFTNMVDSLFGNCATPFSINPNVSGGSGGFQYTWTANGSIIGNGATLNNYVPGQSVTVQVNIIDACSATVTDQTAISITNPPLIIDLGDDINASCIDNTLIDVDISSGSGGYQYQWFVNNQPTVTTPTTTIQSFVTLNVSVIVNDACGMMANDALTLFIPDIPLEITTSPDTAICLNGTAQLWALAQGGEGGFIYQWPQLQMAGNQVSLVNPTSTNSYTVIATDICGESIQSNITVEVMPLVADFIASHLGNELYQFTATPQPSCNDCFFSWEFGDGAQSFETNPLHQFDGLSSHTTTLTVVNSIGCSDDASMLIIAPPAVWIPNSFTPNNDGINDVFQVIGHDILNFDLKIFNRWGEMVFHATDIKEPWTGNYHGFDGDYYVPDGIYSYVVKVKGFNSDAFERKGTIMLMR